MLAWLYPRWTLRKHSRGRRAWGAHVTAATITNTLTDVYTALGAFIVAQLGLATTQVIQGYPNRVAMPTPASGGFVVMSAISKKRLRTNIDNFAGTSEVAPAPGPVTAEQGQQVDIQLDVYGPTASDWADILTTLLRDNVGCLALAPTCQPLYADDPIRAPLTNAEMQYEDRWIVTARIQYNAVVTTAQEYATVLGPVALVDVTPTGFAPPLP
jgi:hypothetical protein